MSDRDRILSALCDTFVPGADGLASASSMGVPARLRAEVAALDRPADIAELDRLLDTVDSPVMNLLLTGRPVRFSSLTQEQRETYLRRWASSPLPLKRKAFQVLKRLTLLYAYGSENSPYWNMVGYARPDLVEPATPAALTVRQPKAGETIQADACVIGSGAGGGVVAAELAARGKRVVILEQARLCTEPDFKGQEVDGSASLFLDRGIGSTQDRSISLLAGSAVGGGTVVNWCTSLRLPPSIREEWRSLGVADDLDPHYDAVEARVDVDTNESERNGANAVLERGLQKLGLKYATIPRDVRGCGDCGHCGVGCRLGAKQSTMRTYLVDACRDGAEILAGCEARRIELSGGAVAGVIARVNGGELRIQTPLVALAAGSLRTPAILLRSRIGGEHVGRHLALHPTAVVAGEYADPIRLWRGVMQSVVSEAFNDVTPGYGFRVECPPALPGILAASLPWWSSAQHRDEMRRAERTAAFILIVRDREGGRVSVDGRGDPRVTYAIDRQSAGLLTHAMIEGLRLHQAAGALRMGTLHTPPLIFDGQADMHAIEPDVRRRGVAPNRVTMFSAHQMATCRIGLDRQTSVANPDGQVWDVSGLYVTDASAFPISSGVNPMLTVMALARRTARRIS
ncbi:MAG TPA: GMC family oxidoreductase [Candidatus Acidoferrum sp.]|nr:GMC family oxidoreductase [Candidatus Acidoferrum sp.]